MSAKESKLQGLGVWLTRPAHQSQSMARVIEAHGGRACRLPLLEIEPLEDEASVRAIKRAIMDLDQYDAAIFISSNAARLGMQWIDRYWPQLPRDLEAFAIGPGTAGVLRGFAWPVHMPDTGVTSEDLLAMPQLQAIGERRIALFRGQGGRELLASTLRARGARVDYLELYRRRSVEYAPGRIGEALEQENVAAVVVTSAQILEALLPLARTGGPGDRLRGLALIVPSERVRERALEAGFGRVYNAGGAGDEAVMQCLLGEALHDREQVARRD